MRSLILTALTLILCHITVVGQVVYTFADAQVSPGDTIELHEVDTVALGPAGANQIWDYSSLYNNTPTTVSFWDVASTPLADSFPNATFAIRYNSSYPLYYSLSEDGFRNGGLGEELDHYMIADDPALHFPLPLTYGATWTDSVSRHGFVGGSVRTEVGVITGSADGYGQLILPYGTFDVLRIHTYQELIRVSDGDSATVISDGYQFRTPGFPWLIASWGHSVYIPYGEGPNHYYGCSWVDGSIGVHLSEGIKATRGLSVFPNPASDQVTICFPRLIGKTGSVRVTDVHGKEVRRLVITSDDTQQLQADIHDLPSGVYMAIVQLGADDRWSARFVVR